MCVRARSRKGTFDGLHSNVTSLPPRADRTQKLKDARSEAAKDIEQLKADKDKEYEKFKREVSGVAQ